MYFTSALFAASVLWTSCGGSGSTGGDVNGDGGYDSLMPDYVIGDIVADGVIEQDGGDPGGEAWDDVLDKDQGDDVAEEDALANCPGNLHCPCDDNSECYSGFCVDTMDGKECTDQCFEEEDCPQGWACSVCATAPDTVYCCVPPFQTLCRPCKNDEDCIPSLGDQGKKYLCIEFGPQGRFCGVECETSSQCPEEFECVGVEVDRGFLQQCRPFGGGDCPCTEKYQQAAYLTVCYNENDAGICWGERTCDSECDAKVPAVESCNFEDDDCNGKVDDNVPSKVCPLENIYGVCEGKTFCVTGEEICQGSFAAPEVCNGQDDDCNGTTDEGYEDQDKDGIANCVDPDIDGDSVLNADDNCPMTPNPDQFNNDYPEDTDGNACDDDDDNDGVPDVVDNCPFIKNQDQANHDTDDMGDICDDDDDNDTVLDFLDNCKFVPNATQSNLDGDPFGDACDDDMDGDGIDNIVDNCKVDYNPNQKNNDADLLGDVCDPDDDNDTVPDQEDNCQYIENTNQSDVDLDKVGDACDCDIDNDEVYNENPGCPEPDPADNCPSLFNPDQIDDNGNGIGDDCEDDWDADTIPNEDDNCPWTFNPLQEDLDYDGMGDVCDEDMDDDGVLNEEDNCPWTFNPQQEDLNGNGTGDACDDDMDGDGDPNETDCAPLNPAVGHLANEKCNDGLDDDCDGLTDEEDSIGCLIFYFDEDNDDYGKELSKCLCEAQGNYKAVVSGDCDDTNPLRNPGVQEVCDNEMDDNCNGSENDKGAVGCTKFYMDLDGDNWGTTDFECYCWAVGDYSSKFTGDCDDYDAQVNPNQKEVCYDGKDNDCSGTQNDENALNSVAFHYDEDGDGWGTQAYKYHCFENGLWKADGPGDCNDQDPAVNPDEDEVCNNGKDDDCDGLQDTEDAVGCVTHYHDGDIDQYGLNTDTKCLCGPAGKYSTTNGGDCQDNNPDIHPGAFEKCNGVDDDCDGPTDEGDPALQCSTPPYATPACVGGECVVGSCSGGFFDVNQQFGDGCECQQDATDNTGNTCSAAINMGSFPDSGASADISGRIVPDEDTDWYRFNAPDSPDSGNQSAPGHDQYHVRVEVLTGAPNIAVHVVRGSCTGSLVCGGDWSMYEWFTDFHGTNPLDGQAAGENPCATPGQTWSGSHECSDNSASYFIKVFRASGSASSCSETGYVIRISNG